MDLKKLAVKSIPIIRMDCPSCIPFLEREVEKLEGVEQARGSYLNKILKVWYDADIVPLEIIEGAVEGLGYRIAYKKYPSLISRIKDLLGKEKTSILRSISDPEFKGEVLQSTLPVAVLFSASTCPTCKVFKRRLEEVAERLEGEAKLYEMDVTSTDTWRRYDVLTLPTALIFREGEITMRISSLPKVDEVENALRI